MLTRLFSTAIAAALVCGATVTVSTMQANAAGTFHAPPAAVYRAPPPTVYVAPRPMVMTPPPRVTTPVVVKPMAPVRQPVARSKPTFVAPVILTTPAAKCTAKQMEVLARCK